MSESSTSAPPAQSDLAMIETLRQGREKMLAEIGKVVVGQKDVVDLILMALFCRGHGADRRRARPGEDAHGPHPRAHPGPLVQPRAVHARPDAQRYRRHGRHRRRPGYGQALVPLHQGSDLREPGACR